MNGKFEKAISFLQTHFLNLPLNISFLPLT